MAKQKEQKKVQKYIFKTNLKIGSIVYKKGQIITMSPCEAKEFANYIYSFEPSNTDCGCNK